MHCNASSTSHQHSRFGILCGIVEDSALETTFVTHNAIEGELLVHLVPGTKVDTSGFLRRLNATDHR